MGGIPPRPSVPPERSEGGQFASKNVRAELYNSTTLTPVDILTRMNEMEKSVVVLRVGDILDVPHNLVIQGASQSGQPCTGSIRVTAMDSETARGVIECSNPACGFVAEVDTTVSET